jgi:hypothetical protein
MIAACFRAVAQSQAVQLHHADQPLVNRFSGSFA